MKMPSHDTISTKLSTEGTSIDVVDLQYTRKFLTQGKVHILTYYDITFITEGEGEFTIGNRTHLAAPGDVFFSNQVRCAVGTQTVSATVML